MTRLMRRISALARDMKISSKVFCIYLLVSLPIAGLTLSFSYSRVATLLHNDISFAAKRTFSQSCEFIEYKIRHINDNSQIIVANDAIKKALETSVDEYNLFDQVLDFTNISTYLDEIEDDPDILRVLMYINGKLYYSQDNNTFFSIDMLKDRQWYGELVRSRYLFLAMDETSGLGADYDREYISLLRVVSRSSDMRDIIAVVRIDFSKENLVTILSKADLTANSVTKLYDESGAVEASSGPADKESDWAEIFRHIYKKDYSFEKIDVGGATSYVSNVKIAKTPWSMVTIVPNTDLRQQRRDEIAQYGIVFSLTLLLSLLLSFFFSRYITKRIIVLSKHMKSFCLSDEYAVHLKPESSDEIGQLIDSYNFMIDRIYDLMKKQETINNTLKVTELRMLQSQIQPHFLYNTLDSINWLNKKNMTKESSQLIMNLSRYYKLSLNCGRDIVRVSEELLHVRYYIEIMNVRYSNGFKLTTDVTDDIGNFCIPKITLQPLIENAIVHGILEKDEPTGEIRLCGWQTADEVIITVRDDGAGMDALTVERLNSEQDVTNGDDYGIRNVRSRVKTYFGDDYGLSFYSVKGVETIVTLRLPRQTAPDDNLQRIRRV